MLNFDTQELKFLFEAVYQATLDDEIFLSLQNDFELSDTQLDNLSVAVREKISHELQKKRLSTTSEN